MSNFALLLQGFATAISPMNLFACLIGGIIGILVGAMPGIGAVAGCIVAFIVGCLIYGAPW